MAIMAMTAPCAVLPMRSKSAFPVHTPATSFPTVCRAAFIRGSHRRRTNTTPRAGRSCLGKQIEIVAEDDQCKPELGTNAATKVLSEGAVAVMGSICSGATKAALPIYNDAKIVSISPSATTPELTQKGDHPYFFRTIASDDVSGHLAGSFAKDKLGLKKVALLHDKGDYGRGFVNYAAKCSKRAASRSSLKKASPPAPWTTAR